MVKGRLGRMGKKSAEDGGRRKSGRVTGTLGEWSD